VIAPEANVAVNGAGTNDEVMLNGTAGNPKHIVAEAGLTIGALGL